MILNLALVQLNTVLAAEIIDDSRNECAVSLLHGVVNTVYVTIVSHIPVDKVVVCGQDSSLLCLGCGHRLSNLLERRPSLIKGFLLAETKRLVILGNSVVRLDLDGGELLHQTHLSSSLSFLLYLRTTVSEYLLACLTATCSKVSFTATMTSPKRISISPPHFMG